MGGSWILYLRFLLGSLSRGVPSPSDLHSQASLTLCGHGLSAILVILLAILGSEIHSKLYLQMRHAENREVKYLEVSGLIWRDWRKVSQLDACLASVRP